MQRSKDSKIQINSTFYNLRIKKFKHSFAYLLICLLGSLVAYLLIGFFGSLVLSASAQTDPGLDITVSPPIIEMNAKPGDMLKNKFRIRNNQSQPIKLTIEVKKLAANDFDGEPVPIEPNANDDFIKWVTIDPTNVTALPREWKDVNFTIDIPTTAAFGYYYVFKISQVIESGFKGTGSQIKGEVLIVTLLNVKKEGAKALGELVEFKPNFFISEYLPVEFSAKIANKGNIHIRPRGNIFVRSLYQKDVGILEINQNVGTVLPDGTRTFKSAWNDGFIVREKVMEGERVKLDGNGKEVTKISINWNKLTQFRIGKYTATLLMVYDDGQRDATLEGVASFWMIPYTAIIVIFISLTLLFFIIRFTLRWYVRRELKRQRER